MTIVCLPLVTVKSALKLFLQQEFSFLKINSPIEFFFSKKKFYMVFIKHFINIEECSTDQVAKNATAMINLIPTVKNFVFGLVESTLIVTIVTKGRIKSVIKSIRVKSTA